MNATDVRGPKLKDATQLGKLVRMLRSMLRRFPSAHLYTTRGVFGVWLDAQTQMRVSYSGNWTDADMRDSLVLFATWWAVDPERMRAPGEPLAGVLRTAQAESAQFSTQEASHGNQ